MAEFDENIKCSLNVCIKPGKFKCGRCSDSYCSTKCQRIDWQFHRYVCFPMPELIPVSDLTDDLCEQLQEISIENYTSDPEPQQSDESNERLELRELKIDQNFDYDDETQLSTIYEEDEEDQENIASVTYCNSAIIQENEVISEQVNHQTEAISAVNEQKTKMTNLNTAINEITLDDCLIIQSITYGDVEEEENKENVPLYFDEGVLKPLMPPNSDVPLVIPKMKARKGLFKDPDDDYEIRKIIKKYPTIKKKTSGPIELVDLKYHEWPNSKNIMGKVLSKIQPNVICFCEDKNPIEEFYDFMAKEIEAYLESIKDTCLNYMPKKNEIIIGEFEGAFYRACVIDPSEYGIIVQFIDYGNLHILKTNQVFPITERISFEICARDFIVDNIPNDLSEKQQEILLSDTLMITNLHKDKRGIFHCDIFGF